MKNIFETTAPPVCHHSGQLIITPDGQKQIQITEIEEKNKIQKTKNNYTNRSTNTHCCKIQNTKIKNIKHGNKKS